MLFTGSQAPNITQQPPRQTIPEGSRSPHRRAWGTRLELQWQPITRTFPGPRRKRHDCSEPPATMARDSGASSKVRTATAPTRSDGDDSLITLPTIKQPAQGTGAITAGTDYAMGQAPTQAGTLGQRINGGSFSPSDIRAARHTHMPATSGAKSGAARFRSGESRRSVYRITDGADRRA